MAINIKSGVQTLVDPSEIQAVRNSRWDGEELDPAAVSKMVRSFEDFGQLEAVMARKDGDTLKLIFGFTRHEACKVYNAMHPDKPMKLKVIASACNEEEAFLKSIEENHCRNAKSAMDDAHAQKVLREEYGWTNERIAEKYGYTEGYVSKLQSLLQLSVKVQRQVHTKEISVNSALGLASLPEEERKEIMDAPEVAGAVNGRARGQAIENKIREKKIEKGGKHPRSLAELKKFLAGVAEESVGNRKELCLKLLRFVNGEISERAMGNAMAEFTP